MRTIKVGQRKVARLPAHEQLTGPGPCKNHEGNGSQDPSLRWVPIKDTRPRFLRKGLWRGGNGGSGSR